jgi:hypothetical protein
VFHLPSGKPVVLMLGVPEPVPGSDWGCPLQITGLNTTWRRPKYVFGIDGLQALHLGMECAGAVLESATPRLEWLGQAKDLGMPKFLPPLPKPEQDRLEAMVEREAIKFWRRTERAHKVKCSKRSNGTKTSKTDENIRCCCSFGSCSRDEWLGGRMEMAVVPTLLSASVVSKTPRLNRTSSISRMRSPDVHR